VRHRELREAGIDPEEKSRAMKKDKK
jgi:hypothetical protein